MFYLKPETAWLTSGACSITVSRRHTDYCCKNSPGFLAVEMVDFVCRACLTGLFFLIPLGDAALPFPSCKVSKALLAWTVKKEIIQYCNMTFTYIKNLLGYALSNQFINLFCLLNVQNRYIFFKEKTFRLYNH